MPLLHRSRSFWYLAAMAPAPFLLAPVVAGEAPWRAALAPTGQAGAILLAAALSIGPLARLLGPPWGAALVRQRRAIGLAAFSYALFHLVFFALSIGRLDYILQGLAWASMWTGWSAMLVLAVMAATSNDLSMRRLGRNWKRLQRLVYVATGLSLAHWLMLSPRAWPALALFAVPALLQFTRARTTLPRDRQGESGRPG